jgi:hypothetical protein
VGSDRAALVAPAALTPQVQSSTPVSVLGPIQVDMAADGLLHLRTD